MRMSVYVIDNSGVLIAARLLPEFINKQEKAQLFYLFYFIALSPFASILI